MTDHITQGELLGTLPLPKPRRQAVRVEKPAQAEVLPLKERLGMERAKIAELLSDNRYGVGRGLDQAWYDQQRQWVSSELDRYGGLLLEAVHALTSRKDPRWPKFWELNAKAEYMAETYQYLREADHMVICLCGFTWGATGVPSEWTEGIWHYALVDGSERPYGRYCLKCQRETWIAARIAEQKRRFEE